LDENRRSRFDTMRPEDFLDARAQRRRPKGVRAAKAALLESFRPWAPLSSAPLTRGFLLMGRGDCMRAADRGSTPRDNRSFLDTRAKRLSPRRESAEKAALLESFHPWAAKIL
jgi:hypothetical protein